MKEKLHPFHIAILIYMNQVGIGLFVLPRIVGEAYGMNGWIMLLAHFFIASINIFLIYLVYKFGKGKSIFELLESTLHKIFLYPLYFLLVAFWSFAGILLCRDFIHIMQLVSFRTSPSSPLVIVVLLLTFIFVKKGIYNISKISTILFLFVIWMVILGGWIFESWDFVNFTHFLFKGSTKPLLYGVFNVNHAFLGYEIILLLFPYLDNTKKNFRGAFYGTLLTTSIYLYTCLLAFGFYSFKQMLEILYPTLVMFEFIQFSFFERIDSVIFPMFLMNILISMTLYYWSALQISERIFSKIKANWLLGALIIVSFLATMKLDIHRLILKWQLRVSMVETGIAFLLPLLLLMILVMKRAFKKKEGGTS